VIKASMLFELGEISQRSGERRSGGDTEGVEAEKGEKERGRRWRCETPCFVRAAQAIRK
jgi:hypothetical protein